MEIIDKLVGLESPLEVGLKINEVIDGLKNTSSLPIGTIIPVNANSSYIPEGTLPCDGAEYSKAQFEQLWENYIKTSFLNTCTYEEYEQDLATYGQCGKFGIRPAEYDPNSVSVVGVPTITDDGIASGFSTANYIQLSNVFTEEVFDTLEIQIEVIPGSSSEHYMQIRTNDNNNQIVINQSANKLNGFATASGTSYNYSSMNIVLNANEKHLIKYKQTANTININVENVATGEIQTGSIPAVMPLINSKTAVYIGRSVFGGFTQNSIDLKQFKIKVDGQNVFDCVNGETFKVPTIKDGAVIQQAMSDGELGKSYNEGLPNITGKFAVGRCTNNFGEGAFVKTSNSGNYSSTDNASDGGRYSFDASLSDDTYGKTDDTSLQKVQMNAVALRYFVVVANGQLSESAMNWSEWASSLQSKANKTDVDGQWIASELLLSTATAVGEYEIDLSDYLPKDSYCYELMLTMKAARNSSNDADCFVSSSIIPNVPILRTSSNAFATLGQVNLPVGTDKRLKFSITTNALTTTTGLTVHAYRRVGKNI